MYPVARRDASRFSARPQGRSVTADEDATPALDQESFYEVVQSEGRPVVTAGQVARRRGWTDEQANAALDALAAAGEVERVDVAGDPVVWYPTEWGDLAATERLVVFPQRREIVADKPDQFTRAQLSQFAHLTDTTGSEGYRYEVREADIWNAPYDDLEGLLGTVRDVLPAREPVLEEFVEEQWRRAHRFRLYTHEDGYVVLEAENDDLMGNVARQHLSEEQLRAPISDSESWVAREEVAAVKRTLYEAGYPVQDERDLDAGERLPVSLALDLRDYQADWVERFMEQQSGVFVGPSGSGKTVAALGVLSRVEGETLVLVPSRELAGQWHDEILRKTTLDESQVGEYHGGEKNVRPVTIATYQIAGMDRHRQLFDSRAWGLIVFDECHYIPAPVFSRAADLQGKHRLGLSATPVRESGDSEEIFTLVGPPIGTDWDALFEAGFVQEPTVEIRYVPWDEATEREEYASSVGHGKRQLAATNPAKLEEIRWLLRRHHDKKALVFVDYLDHGEEVAAALDAPFISGETRHGRRQHLFQEFRDGRLDTLVVSRVGDEGIDLPDAELAVVASGLGGSRRQGAQRAGRTMRPQGSALVYVLATRGTKEEEFARQRLRHLSEKGVRVHEADAHVTAGGEEDGDATGDVTGDAT
ncbi:MAG: DEAD/DEAH box helicase [Haloarculaceae archaeon]